MKLLFDENLSRKLPFRLIDLYPDSIHVASVNLLQVPDSSIWEYASANDFVILITDSDFFTMATATGPPPKVIWLRRWTHPTRDAESVLRREAIRIAEFVRDRELGVLILDR